jgi:GDPmannose 4,6-dehydratase
MTRTSAITGISGQDGAYLAAQLLARGDTVIGTRRPGMQDASLWRLHELHIADHPQLRLIELDIESADACETFLRATQPHSLFHFAGQSRVSESFRDPLASVRANGFATLNLLEAMRTASVQTRFVLASTAELFGDPRTSPQNEDTPFAPHNPYAIAKKFAHEMTRNYRNTYGLHASCAILFNHESPLRGADFVSRKIAAAVAQMAKGESEPLALGNLAACRDFGYAPEYVAAIASMMEQESADDYVLATGIATSIREFVDFAFASVDITLTWRGAGQDEHAIDTRSGRIVVLVNAEFFRPLDAAVLVGDATRARKRLAFSPRTDAGMLARLMVESELRRMP